MTITKACLGCYPPQHNGCVNRQICANLHCGECAYAQEVEDAVEPEQKEAGNGKE